MPINRVVFAGSDVSPWELGWIEGAIASGAKVAVTIGSLLPRAETRRRLDPRSGGALTPGSYSW